MAEDLTPQDGGEAPADGTPAETPVEGGAPVTADLTPQVPVDGEADGTPDADPATGAPESYADFTMPEGIKIDLAAMEKFTPMAKELNLTQDQAQKLVDIQATMMAEAGQAMQDDLDSKIDTWVDGAENDREIGGNEEVFDAKVATANKAVVQFGTTGLLELFDATGIGNHPEVIRVFYRIGKLLENDKVMLGSASGPSTPKSAAEILFPSMAKE